MNISNDAPAMNYVDYFTNQFPKDLAQMAVLRDELATRQGALTAAEDAVADRKKAAQELEAAKKEAEAIRADAKKEQDVARQAVLEATAKAQKLTDEATALAEVRGAAVDAAVKAAEIVLQSELKGSKGDAIVTSGLKDVAANLR